MADGVADNDQFESIGKRMAIRRSIASESGEHFSCFQLAHFHTFTVLSSHVK